MKITDQILAVMLSASIITVGSAMPFAVFGNHQNDNPVEGQAVELPVRVVAAMPDMIKDNDYEPFYVEPASGVFYEGETALIKVFNTHDVYYSYVTSPNDIAIPESLEGDAYTKPAGEFGTRVVNPKALKIKLRETADLLKVRDIRGRLWNAYASSYVPRYMYAEGSYAFEAPVEVASINLISRSLDALKIKWTPGATDAIRYDLYLNGDKVDSVETLEYTFEGLKSNKQYTVGVSAVYQGHANTVDPKATYSSKIKTASYKTAVQAVLEVLPNRIWIPNGLIKKPAVPQLLMTIVDLPDDVRCEDIDVGSVMLNGQYKPLRDAIRVEDLEGINFGEKIKMAQFNSRNKSEIAKMINGNRVKDKILIDVDGDNKKEWIAFFMIPDIKPLINGDFITITMDGKVHNTEFSGMDTIQVMK